MACRVRVDRGHVRREQRLLAGGELHDPGLSHRSKGRGVNGVLPAHALTSAFFTAVRISSNPVRATSNASWFQYSRLNSSSDNTPRKPMSAQHTQDLGQAARRRRREKPAARR